MKQAVILAGGKGTRLQARLGGKPKPLIDIGGIPLLERQLRLLSRHGFNCALILVSYGAQMIQEYCRQRADRNPEITILDDGNVPRGTAGAVLQALPYLDRTFLVLYGDTMLNVELSRFWNWHLQNSDASASLFLHPNDHPQDSDLVEIDDQDQITAFHSYPHPEKEYLANLSNAALYIVEREALKPWHKQAGQIDFAKDLFPEMLQGGALLRGYQSFEYIKDIGTPDRLDSVSRHLASGLIEQATLEATQRAVFIDRDGTLNHSRGFIKQAEDFELFNFAGNAVKRLNESEWRAVLITNQPVVARGETTFQELKRISAKLDTELARAHAYLDRSYICLHHPDRGFAGEIASLKVDCDCRKPATGLIKRAQQDLNLDLTQSWFIGDSTADVGAAVQAGISSILVQTGEAGLDDKYPFCADITVRNFAAAVNFILKTAPLIEELCNPLLPVLNQESDWFIGGESMAEIEAFTVVLRRQLQQEGKTCFSLPFSRWQLQKPAANSAWVASVDMSEIENAVQTVAARYFHSVQIQLPYFSVKHGKRSPLLLKQEFPAESIILWHGTAAIELAHRFKLKEKTIYIENSYFGKLEKEFVSKRAAAHVVDLKIAVALDESLPELIV